MRVNDEGVNREIEIIDILMQIISTDLSRRSGSRIHGPHQLDAGLCCLAKLEARKHGV